ncbi:hypothetical protein [Streptomyces sp. HNM1019]|uniref:hypothetical protein n=1 Tax=Streptomyces sp. HNM1019 TaxID=3424717 RepID=UPI003D776AE9
MNDSENENNNDNSNENGNESASSARVPLHERRRPWWHWHRVARSRQRLAVIMAVVGALLGALLGGAGVAWQAEAGPFADDRACWGALGRDDVAALFDGKRDIETSEVPITSDRIGSEGPSGECRLTSPRGRRITVQAHQLDTRFGGAGGQWADEFLSARLTPLGDGLLGMASDTRAWLAVPDGCIGRPSGIDTSGPTVIDLETGWTVYDDDVNTEDRDALARAVVKLVNHYMADKGCTSKIADPVPQMSGPPRFPDEKKDAMCGIKGLRLPAAFVHDGRGDTVVTRGAGPVRTCDRDVLFNHPELRLMTIEDPRLAILYERMSLDGAKDEVSADEQDGYGFVRDDMGLFQAKCQTGQVTFLVRAENGRHPSDIRTILPRYVAAEADRIGCGPLHITVHPHG